MRILRSAALALALVAFGMAASAAGAAQVNIVSQKAPPASIPANVEYFETIQAAVDASTAGDYVLIEPGVYDESVKVTSAQSGIVIRGMNRNTVIVDGQHKVGNGIEIDRANDVWVENLTVRNFEFGSECPDEECGNDIWWNGGSESKKVGAHGWYGSYLTAYEAEGLKGGYGIFTGHETEGSWDHIYASGFADSGMYLGACQECDATIKHATMEDDAVGYSGSNSGGNLVIERSTFAHNTVGIAPNSENPGDAPPPQDGECGRPNIEDPDPTPTISTTDIQRCTIIRHNTIVENNNLTVAPNGSTEIAPWGAGIELPGDYADLVENNVISGNPNFGVLGFDYPNPFPFEPESPPENIISFQLAGNRISNNKFSDNGYNHGPFEGDVALFSGAAELLDEDYGYHFPPEQSTNNCLLGNHFSDATFPIEIQKTLSCKKSTTPNPGGGGFAVLALVELIENIKKEREEHPPVAQSAPPSQPTMPHPCEGVPKNPLCK